MLLIPAIGAIVAAWVRTTEEGKRFWSQSLLAIPAVKSREKQTREKKDPRADST